MITGGAKCLGQAIALAYANEEAKVNAADLGESMDMYKNKIITASQAV